MSFEMKYDKNGMPIKGQEPTFEETKQEPVVEAQSEPEVEQPVEENLQQETQVSEPIEQKVESKTLKQSPSKEDNFARLREGKERAEQERDDAIRYAREIQAKYTQPQQQPQQEEDLSININPDDLVEGKHLSKVDKKIRKLEEQIQQYQQKTTEMTLETQLRNQYPDFDKIVSKENIELLRQTDPDIAEAIYNTPDLYKKASLAYKMIKKLDIAKEDNYVQDRELAQRNAAKPKPVNTISPQQGDTPLSKANAFANGLTDELKDALRREMDTARKNM